MVAPRKGRRGDPANGRVALTVRAVGRLAPVIPGAAATKAGAPVVGDRRLVGIRVAYPVGTAALAVITGFQVGGPPYRRGARAGVRGKAALPVLQAGRSRDPEVFGKTHVVMKILAQAGEQLLIDPLEKEGKPLY